MNCFFWWNVPIDLLRLFTILNESVHDLFPIISEPARGYLEKAGHKTKIVRFEERSLKDVMLKIPSEIDTDTMDLWVNYDWHPSYEMNSFVFIIRRSNIVNGKIQLCKFSHSMKVSRGSSPDCILAMSRFYKAMRELMYRLKADRVVDSRWAEEWDGEGIESEVEHAYFMFQPSGRQLLNERMELGENSPWILDVDYPGSTSDSIEIFVDPSEVDWYRNGGLTAM